jgi:mRNA-degrading endonuclease YafQ of YafQ-DinJ toxin-antitoxin module
VTADEPSHTLDLTPKFLEEFGSKDFSQTERRAIRRALQRLDDEEQQPSLRVHQLTGDLAGTWSASASASLRIVFLRDRNGRKIILSCSKHYDR